MTIPAYNEEISIGKVIADIKKVLDALSVSYGIVVVDDGSIDQTAKAAAEAGARVHSHPKNYGLAETFRTEMDICISLKPKVIVHTDADGQYSADEIPKLIEPVLSGKADLVLGSRFRGKIDSMPLIKWIGNKAFTAIVSHIVRLPISDGQTGFRAFTPEIAKMDIKSNFTYTQEQIIHTAKAKKRIVEVPIHFLKREEGKSKLMKHPLHFAMRAGINLLRIYRDYEPLKFFGIIGCGIFSLGMLLALWFVWLHFTTGIDGHLGLLIAMLLLVLTGIQVITFAFLADMKRA